MRSPRESFTTIEENSRGLAVLPSSTRGSRRLRRPLPNGNLRYHWRGLGSPRAGLSFCHRAGRTRVDQCPKAGRSGMNRDPRGLGECHQPASVPYDAITNPSRALRRAGSRWKDRTHFLSVVRGYDKERSPRDQKTPRPLLIDCAVAPVNCCTGMGGLKKRMNSVNKNTGACPL